MKKFIKAIAVKVCISKKR